MGHQKTKSKRPRLSERDYRLLRKISCNEHPETQSGYTDDQKEWERQFRRLRGHLHPGSGLQHMVIGFRLSQKHRGPSRPGLDLETPIYPVDEITVVTLSLIDPGHWEGHKSRFRRGNWLEHRLRVDPDSGELVASSYMDNSKTAEYYRQRNVFITPLQDHPVYELRHYSPRQLIPEPDPLLRAPHSGIFRVEKTPAHLTLFIGRAPYFRMLREEGDSLKYARDDLPKTGSEVAAGDVIAEWTREAKYGFLCTRTKGEKVFPIIDHIGGDVLPATARRNGSTDDLCLATVMMSQLARAVDDETFIPSTLESWAPRHLAEVAMSKVVTFPHTDEWGYSPKMRAELLQAIRPDASHPLYAPANVSEVTALEAAEHTDSGLLLRYCNGEQQLLPPGTQLLDSVQSGAGISPGSPVANWIPRDEAWGYSWDQLVQVPYLSLIAAEFLRQRVILPGTAGYSGNEVLLDVAYLPQPGILGKARRYIDFRPTRDCFYDGTYVGPPIAQTDWSDTVRVVNCIGYDGTPKGDRLKPPGV